MVDAGRTQVPLTLDTSFQVDFVRSNVADIHFLANGQMVVSGDMRFPGMTFSLGLARLNIDGTRDASFPLLGAGAGKIYPWQNYFFTVGGQSYIRLNDDWSVDHTYRHNLVYPIFGGFDIHVYSDGKVLMAGKHRLYSPVDTTLILDEYCLVRRDTNGDPDTTFQHRRCDFGGHTDLIQPMADGRFYISGLTNYFEGSPVGRIFRIWPDGSLDTSFNTNIFWGYAAKLYQYPDGRLLAMGAFQMSELPGDTVHLIRLLPNGELDTTYNNTNDFRHILEGPFPSFAVLGGIVPIEPNMWVATGTFEQLNGQQAGGIVVFDSLGNELPFPFNGTDCDTMYYFNSTNYTVSAAGMKRAPDGSYFIYGQFNGFDDGLNNYPDQGMIVKLYALDVGLEELKVEGRELRVWPNPGLGSFSIEVPKGFGSGELKLQDALGRTVLTEAVRKTTGQLTVEVPLHFPMGIYQVRLAGVDGSNWSAKWIKQ